MKFNFFIFLFVSFIFFGCVPITDTQRINNLISTKGFAYIFDETDRTNKLVSGNFDNNKIQIGHSTLKVGTLVKITNLQNDKTVIGKIYRRSTYPIFYNVLITETLAYKLDLDLNIPYVEIRAIKRNDSFIAGKAKTFAEEKKVHNKAPVTNIKIDNISKTKIQKKKKFKKPNKFSINLANFYSLESAKSLKSILIKELPSLEIKSMKIKKINKNDYKFILGPYNAINKLKNDYINLKNYGFEELEIIIDG
ncbi:MAG: hypothetical protein ACJZ4O_00380 [Pelagibacteraceae bacterium]